MVTQSPLDYMHNVCLGVMKLLLKLWFKSKSPLLSAKGLGLLSDELINLAKYIPKEFARKTQSLAELGRWKATTLRLFLLYIGSVILQDKLTDDIVYHFNLLSCAIRILCNPSQYKTLNKVAKDMLQDFVIQLKNEGFEYGEEYVTFNPHTLIHLADECMNQGGPLDNFSAFEFENFLQFLKKLVRKHEKPLQQIHRRISEGHFPKKKFRLPEGCTIEMRKEIKRAGVSYGCEKVYEKLVYQDFELTSKPPNNCCFLEDKNIVMIQAIGEKNGEKCIFGKVFTSTSSLSNYPVDSGTVGFHVLGKLSKDVKRYAVEKIIKKVVHLVYNENSYAVELLHH